MGGQGGQENKKTHRSGPRRRGRVVRKVGRGGGAERERTVREGGEEREGKR